MIKIERKIKNTRNLSLPKHQRIERAILGYIRQNRMQPGSKMPGERRLAKTLGVSSITVSKGMSNLAEQAILVRKTGSGTYIARTPIARETISTVRFGLISRYREDNQYLAGIRKGMEQSLAECDVELTVLYQNHDRYLKNMNQHDLSGIAVIAPMCPSAIRELAYIKLLSPLSIIGAQHEGFEDVTFSCEDQYACRDAVTYLKSLGHSRIGILTVPNHPAISLRMHGFFQGMYDAHLPVHPDWIFSSPDYDGCGVDRHILEQLLDKLQQPHAPTALIAPSPSLMLTAYRAADSLDIRIPRDLSIVGMDEIPHGEYVNVAPTTLRQPLEAIGKAAGEHLWASFSSKESDVKHLFKPTLIERESCQPLSTPS